MFTYEEAYSESMKYFDGDELATTTWINKYALRSEKGELLESNPKMMHDRIIKEVMIVEKMWDKSARVLNEKVLKDLFYNFRYLIPGGSSMSGIGNNYREMSLSNCFVIDAPVDSYGGIMKADQEIVQLCKRRGGVGVDISNLRPLNTHVSNAALTSSGAVSFAERFSNTTREICQNGRRGALMISMDVRHPDIEKFIDAKLDLTKITGANISVKVTDQFMNCVKEDSEFVQRFPITATDEELGSDLISDGKLHEGKTPGTYYRIIRAKKLFRKLTDNNWKSAEPGVLFWDKIISESPADFYEGFETISTNPCGEIPLCKYDSCRLIAINLKSFINDAFLPNAAFNIQKLAEVSRNALFVMDDIIELEIEKIQSIINKIENDPESDEVKSTELKLWNNILDKTRRGRRTGIGITGLGDALAMLDIKYGSEESIKFCDSLFSTIAVNVYQASIDLARIRAPFKVWDKDELHPMLNTARFLQRIYNICDKEYQEDWIKYGRRNISCLTCAPTGTVSLMTQSSSGIEPVFKCWYIRRRKTSDPSKATFTDKNGDMFEEFKVFHKGFVEWYRLSLSDSKNLKYSYEQCLDILNRLTEDDLKSLFEKSPYFNSTAQDIDWVAKVKLQGVAQKWIDHSISCTVNLPKDVSQDLVNKIYMTAWEVGCKGITIYRDGSRDGVLITKSDKPKMPELGTPRPEVLKCRIVRFKNGGENWIAFIGLYNEMPYEIFTGKVDDDIRYLPKSVTEGEIVRVDCPENAEEGSTRIPHRYDFRYKVRYGYTNTLPCINEVFKVEYYNYARFISGMLRGGVPVVQVINVVKSLNSDMGEIINTWKNGVARALKQFVSDGTLSGSKCSKCGTELVFQGGCMICPNCGESKCE
jgi:ribonucleoside-diphosphate reductase alpha chain